MKISRSLATARWRKSSYSNAEGGSCVEVAEGAWRKSSYSNADGGSCVEVAAGAWRKSSYSNDEGGDCVEVADGCGEVVPVRDSKVPDGPVLLVGAVAWTRFLGEVTSS
ncbi:DUF397 domain-containing protein [Streptomyces sp. SDr-06]|uniref:DUF397 domain-containing protein n=1 Tax=Streptomyces sp. SDr-06 TaxID=2267702 RepID=UPI000DE840D0|nr:DUF397 domain-containing protein [Streptomyces sp. SDr-06]RCH64366.1 DUF397 domain-containing protein [Streptomyces sp. SDr-06]